MHSCQPAQTSFLSPTSSKRVFAQHFSSALISRSLVASLLPCHMFPASQLASPKVSVRRCSVVLSRAQSAQRSFPPKKIALALSHTLYREKPTRKDFPLCFEREISSVLGTLVWIFSSNRIFSLSLSLSRTIFASNLSLAHTCVWVCLVKSFSHDEIFREGNPRSRIDVPSHSLALSRSRSLSGAI